MVESVNNEEMLALAEPKIVQSRKVNLVICGHKFTTTDVTLRKYPGTRLADLAKDAQLESEYFFDRDADVFKEVMRFYRSGVLHMPKGICTDTFKEEVQFWNLPTQYIAACCEADFEEMSEFEKQFNWFESRIPRPETSCRSYQYVIWAFLTDPDGPYTKCSVLSKLWALLYLIMTLTQTITISIGSHHSFREDQLTSNATNLNRTTVKAKESRSTIELLESSDVNSTLLYINYICSFFFIAEVTVRFISCPDKKYFCKIPLHILDLTIALIELVNTAFVVAALVVPETEEMLTFTVYLMVIAMFAGQMRVLRLLGYATMYSGLRVIFLTLYKSWKEIALLVIVLTISVLIFGPIVFYADIQNESDGSFDHIFIAYWWVIVTMTTVGYGDFYPSSLPGYLFAVIVMLTGLMLTALPVAIIGANFYTYYEFNEKRQKQKAKEKSAKQRDEQKIKI